MAGTANLKSTPLSGPTSHHVQPTTECFTQIELDESDTEQIGI